MGTDTMQKSKTLSAYLLRKSFILNEQVAILDWSVVRLSQFSTKCPHVHTDNPYQAGIS